MYKNSLALICHTGLQVLSLAKHQKDTLKTSWMYGIAAAYEPYLVSVNKTSLLLWDRRTMEPVTVVEEANIQKVVPFLAMPLETGKLFAWLLE